LTDLAAVSFVRAEPDHGGMTAYAVWTAGGRHHGEVEQFPDRYGSYWRAWRRHPASGRVPVVCQACGAPRRFPRRRGAAAAMLGYERPYQADHAALVLATAALRLLTACDHGEEQPGTCPDCEPVPPLVQVALNALPLLDAKLTDIDPVALRDALRQVEVAAGAHGHRDLSQFAGALRRAIG
jgi:hypothetical protein